MLLGLGACSSVTKGTSQDVAVDTKDVKQAKCTLKNEKGSWIIPSTPGSVEVSRGGGDLAVNCVKENYQNGQMMVSQGFEPMTLGNILIGGVVGVVVDAASGAAFDYPPTVSILLTPSDGYVPPPTPEQEAGSDIENYMADFQGNWTGYKGGGCFEINSWSVDITINASIEKNLLKIALAHKNNFGNDHGFGLKGMDSFSEDQSLTFDPEYNTVDRIKVQADKDSGKLIVTFDGKCKVVLKQTYKETIAWNFKGKPAIKPTTIVAEKILADMSAFQGNWTGYQGRGCLYYRGNPSDVTVNANIQGPTLRMKLSHVHSYGTDEGAGLKAVDNFAPDKILIFDPEYSGLNRIKVKASDATGGLTVTLDSGCTVQLTKTDRQVISDKFTGKSALKSELDS